MSGAGGALRGVRVVNFGRQIAAPLTAMLLADNGAEVVRVDSPQRTSPPPLDAVVNRGKRRITLDLETAADRAHAAALVARADVVIESSPAGEMTRWGLGGEELTAALPRLVYCSMPPFAPPDERAAVPGADASVSAAAGAFAPVALADGAAPVFTPITLPSNIAAFLGAFAITAALIARDRDGLGQLVEVPLYDAMFEIVPSPTTLPDANFPDSLVPMSDVQLAAYSGGGTYRCQDGAWIDFWPISHKFTSWFARAAGIEDWALHGLLDRDRVFASPTLLDELRRRLATLFEQRPAAEWEELGRVAGVPLGMHRTLDEWIADEHARASRAVVPVDDPELGAGWQPGWAVTLSRTPSLISGRRLLDADRAAILADLELPAPSAPAPITPQAAPAPLDGIEVVDTSQIIAGPTVARVLADYGARVVKIANPRSPTPVDHLFVNRGKRMALIDLRTAEGLDILCRLVDRADVLVQNFTRGRAEEFGMGYEALSARRPGLVYCSLSAYGYHGPWGAGRGYEPLGQTVTGLTRRLGGDGQPRYQPMRRVADYGAGILGAFGVALALFERGRSGRGQHVETSLAHASTFHQAPFIVRPGGDRAREPHGPEARGWGALYRLYRAADGWFFLAGDERAQATLSRGEIAALADLAGCPDGDLEAALEERFAEAPLAEWLPRLREVGIEATAAQTVAEMLEDPYALARGLSVRTTYRGKPVGTVGPAARLSRTPAVAVRLPPAYGEDTVELLAEIGLAARVGEFADRGIAVSAPLPDSGPASSPSR